MFKEIILVKLLVVAYLCGPSTAYLEVRGKDLYFKGEKVFLSGANVAWVDPGPGNDWGDGLFWSKRSTLEGWLKSLHDNGGNTARVWLYCQGSTLAFDNQGYCTGTDHQGDLISELQAFLDDAEKHNILIIFTIFCNAIFDTQTGFITDEGKIEAYVENALKPMVEGVKGKKALAAWEIINEPEGAMDIDHYENDGNTCWDPSRWHSSSPGMGFEMKRPIKNILRFFNWVTAGIHDADPSALVTVGVWKPQTNTDKCDNCYNIYRDECLVAAGGKKNGVLDFYQMHTYESNDIHPSKRSADQYGLDKPLIVGEWSKKTSGLQDSATCYRHYYNTGYAGALAWLYTDHWDNEKDDFETINEGLNAIRYETDNGKIEIQIS